MQSRTGRTALVAAALLLLLGAAPGPGGELARDQVAAGFRLDQLTAISGAGSDPGPGNPQARLGWAVNVAVPDGWRRAVPVMWRIGDVTPGHFALSFHDGSTVVSPQLLRRPAEELLATVAHEMGHQIAIALVPAGDGSPPRGFVELLPGNPYNRFDEGWADCVSRVWTGSRIFTRTERGPCPEEAARYVAALLTDPENLRREGLPSPSPSPMATPTASPEPEGSPGPPATEVPAGPGRLLLGAAILVAASIGLLRLVRALVPNGSERR